MSSEKTKTHYHVPVVIHRNGIVEHEFLKKSLPCQCWDIMGISWQGHILQCVDYPSKYNYGKVGEVDLAEAWLERNRNQMDNLCCRDCNVKTKNYRELFKKYIR